MIENKTLSTSFNPTALLGSDVAYTNIGHGLEVLLPKDLKSGDQWLIEIDPYVTEESLASTLQGDQLFVTSSLEILSAVQHNIVIEQNSTKESYVLLNTAPVPCPNFRSRFLATYFNHLFWLEGRVLRWTDLNNIWEWVPHPHNESDFRELEWECENATALVRVGDHLYLHFPDSIYRISYVGKPAIVQVEQAVHGIGSVSARGLIVQNNVTFFVGPDNFYLHSPQTGLQTFGNDVWKRFVRDRGPIDDLWAYVDLRHNELCWVSGGLIFAFNFVEKHWCLYSADGILDHVSCGWLPDTPVDLDSVPESALIIDRDKIDDLESVWVTEDAVLREVRENDSLARVHPMEQPFLATDDITYGDLHTNKKVDLMMIDADVRWPWTGFRLYVSGKDYVTQGDNWIDCGLWTSWRRDRQVDFPSVAGKALRFKFVLEDCLNWSGLLPNGGLQLDGKLLDVADGQIIMNGSRGDFLGRQFMTLYLDGRQTFDQMVNDQRPHYSDINAFGERVDLSKTLIGPDK